MFDFYGEALLSSTQLRLTSICSWSDFSLSCSQYRRHGVLCTGVRQVNHSEVHGKGSKTNALIRIRLSRLFTTLAVKTKKNTIV